MIAGSLETIVDKVIITKEPEKIDILVGTFYRNFAFFILTIIIGLFGIFGKLSFVFNIHLLILAIICPLNSLAYDYFLRNVEVSRFNGIFYAFPIIFLFIEKIFLHKTFSVIQIIGTLLLVIGAILFSMEANKRKFLLSWKALFWMLIRMIPIVYLFVTYKLYSTSINDVSFYFSIWAMLIIFYIFIILITKKYKKLKETAKSNNFLAKTFIAKGFDVFSSIFYLEALGIASLTAVSAIDSFSPLITLVLLICLSFFTKINISEDFSKKTLVLKIVATMTLIAGGFCMFLP